MYDTIEFSESELLDFSDTEQLSEIESGKKKTEKEHVNKEKVAGTVHQQAEKELLSILTGADDSDDMNLQDNTSKILDVNVQKSGKINEKKSENNIQNNNQQQHQQQKQHSDDKKKGYGETRNTEKTHETSNKANKVEMARTIKTKDQQHEKSPEIVDGLNFVDCGPGFKVCPVTSIKTSNKSSTGKQLTTTNTTKNIVKTDINKESKKKTTSSNECSTSSKIVENINKLPTTKKLQLQTTTKQISATNTSRDSKTKLVAANDNINITKTVENSSKLTTTKVNASKTKPESSDESAVSNKNAENLNKLSNTKITATSSNKHSNMKLEVSDVRINVSRTNEKLKKYSSNVSADKPLKDEVDIDKAQATTKASKEDSETTQSEDNTKTSTVFEEENLLVPQEGKYRPHKVGRPKKKHRNKYNRNANTVQLWSSDENSKQTKQITVRRTSTLLYTPVRKSIRISKAPRRVYSLYGKTGDANVSESTKSTEMRTITPNKQKNKIVNKKNFKKDTIITEKQKVKKVKVILEKINLNEILKTQNVIANNNEIKRGIKIPKSQTVTVTPVMNLKRKREQMKTDELGEKAIKKNKLQNDNNLNAEKDFKEVSPEQIKNLDQIKTTAVTIPKAPVMQIKKPSPKKTTANIESSQKTGINFKAKEGKPSSQTKLKIQSASLSQQIKKISSESRNIGISKHQTQISNDLKGEFSYYEIPAFLLVETKILTRSEYRNLTTQNSNIDVGDSQKLKSKALPSTIPATVPSASSSLANQNTIIPKPKVKASETLTVPSLPETKPTITPSVQITRTTVPSVQVTVPKPTPASLSRIKDKRNIEGLMNDIEKILENEISKQVKENLQTISEGFSACKSIISEEQKQRRDKSVIFNDPQFDVHTLRNVLKFLRIYFSSTSVNTVIPQKLSVTNSSNNTTEPCKNNYSSATRSKNSFNQKMSITTSLPTSSSSLSDINHTNAFHNEPSEVFKFRKIRLPQRNELEIAQYTPETIQKPSSTKNQDESILPDVPSKSSISVSTQPTQTNLNSSKANTTASTPKPIQSTVKQVILTPKPLTTSTPIPKYHNQTKPKQVILQNRKSEMNNTSSLSLSNKPPPVLAVAPILSTSSIPFEKPQLITAESEIIIPDDFDENISRHRITVVTTDDNTDVTVAEESMPLSPSASSTVNEEKTNYFMDDLDTTKK